MPLKAESVETVARALVVRDDKAAITTATRGRLCIHDGTCTRNAVARGLCQSHYQAAAQLVRARITVNGQLVTWRLLERAGRCLPVHRTAKLWFLEGIVLT